MAISKIQGISAASLIAAVPLVVGGETYLDSKYVAASEFKQLQSTVEETNILFLKAQIYEAKKSIREDPGNEIIEDYLHALIDQLCLKRPEDAECSEQ